METFLTRILKKQTSLAMELIKQKQFHTQEEALYILSQFGCQLELSLRQQIQSNCKKSFDTKNQLKHKNKSLCDIKAKTQKAELQWEAQKAILQKQLERSKAKTEKLLKKIESQQIKAPRMCTKHFMEFSVQCELQNQRYESVILVNKKQNISLSNSIVQLKQIIREKEQELNTSEILIQQLMNELRVNETQMDTARDSASTTEIQDTLRDFSSEESLSELDRSSIIQNYDYCIDDPQRINMQNQTCGGSSQEANQDLSTIDGSCATNKDFALPQWLQFDEPSSEVFKQPFQEFQYQDCYHKMWPELLWDRINHFIWEKDDYDKEVKL